MQDNRQPLVHPICLGVLLKQLIKIDKDPTYQRPDDVIAGLTLSAVISIAYDMRRMANHVTRVELGDPPPTHKQFVHGGMQYTVPIDTEIKEGPDGSLLANGEPLDEWVAKQQAVKAAKPTEQPKA